MAFEEKQWEDRISEFPGRRILNPVEGEPENVFEVDRDEGEVAVPGDAFDADTMNNLEHRIAEGFADVSDELEAHEKRRDNPHVVTKAQVGLGQADNTPDAEKRVAYATEAGKVSNALTINGTAFDGSKAVEMDIGGGGGGDVEELRQMVEALQAQCSALETKLSGKLDTTGTAAAAAKLATARTIALSGFVNGSASFNGSSNITIATSTTQVQVVSTSVLTGVSGNFINGWINNPAGGILVGLSVMNGAGVWRTFNNAPTKDWPNMRVWEFRTDSRIYFQAPNDGEFLPGLTYQIRIAYINF